MYDTSDNIFGFSTEPSSGGDFTPIIKYDARAGRIFRIDRTLGNDGYVSDSIDITNIFRAVMDFENIEVGWLDFPAGSAPSFALVPRGQQLPPKPSEKHKNGMRVLLMLDKASGGEKRVREMAGSAKSFLGGVQQVVAEYLRQKDQHPGMLPVISLAGTMPVETGTGSRKSTNYRPQFRIDAWVPRPADLVHTPAPNTAPTPAHAPLAQMTPQNGRHPPQQAPWDEAPAPAAPRTGGQVVTPQAAPPPQPVNSAASLADDFG